MKTLSLALGLAVLSATAMAGERGGNGGNSGVCFSDAGIVKEIKANDNRISNSHIKFITSVTPLDQYEARAVHDSENPDQSLVLPKSDETADEYAARMINRFDYLPRLKEILNGKLAAIQKNRMYYNEGGIDRIYDTNEAYYLDPEKCVIATAIRQTSNENGEVKLEFDNRLFNFKKGSQGSRNAQGVLILHETVLRWALDLGQKDAKGARELTAYLLQKNIARKDLVKKMRDLGFMGSIQAGNTQRVECSDKSTVPLKIVAPDKTSVENYCMSKSWIGSDLLAPKLGDFKPAAYYWDPTFTRLGVEGDTAESSLITKTLKEMVGVDMKTKVPAGYLKELATVIKYSAASDFSGVYQSLTYIQKEERPYCAAKAPAGAIADSENKIKAKEAEIAALKEQLSRAVFGKKKIEEKIELAEYALDELKKGLASLLAADANFTKCQNEWKEFKAKYQKGVEAAIEDEKDIIQDIVVKKLKELDKKNWMSEASKSKGRKIIEDCESSIMDAGDFVKSCLHVDTAFNETIGENPSTED